MREVMFRLAGLREKRGYTQGELAAHLGVARETLNRWENGRLKITWPRLVAYAEAVGADLPGVPR